MKALRLIALLSLLVLSALGLACQSANPERIADQVYLKDKGAAFTLDVFKPKKPNGIALVFMVSGGWVSDHNNINPVLGKEATDRGFTVFQVVHGAQPRYKVPEIVKQVTRAVRFIRFNAAKYGVNPNKLAVMGGSAGGHLSLMVASMASPGDPTATDPIEKVSAEVQSVAVFFPPTDFLNYGKPGVFSFDIPALRAAYGLAFTNDIKTINRDALVKIGTDMSPMTYFSKKMPPTMIVHGDADQLVPIQQSEIAIKKLEELGVKNKLITVPGKGHGWEGMDVQIQEMFNWILETIK